MAMRRLWLSVLLLLVAGCQVRQADPVKLSDPDDAEMSCAEIATEIAANEREALQLAGKAEALDQSNDALRAPGTVFAPLLLAVDLSDAEKIEIRALADRNARLEKLRARKDCEADDANL